VMEIGKKVFFIYKGRLWWQGGTADLMHSDNAELNEFVFASKAMQGLKKS
jgi:phospholipid/cholesterol/gamma-HCH transport system ATP-binding protein